MADAFYFNSPRRSGFFKNRASLRARLKIGGRKRAAKMDIPLQHVGVVRFDEPTFCPSDITSMIPLFPLRNSLFFSASHDVQTSALTPEAEVQTPTIEPMQPRTLHPRPYSADIWEEEEGRRTRFALSDDEELDALRQRRLQPERSPSHSDNSAVDHTAHGYPIERNNARPAFGLQHRDGIHEMEQGLQLSGRLIGPRYAQSHQADRPVDSGNRRTHLSLPRDPVVEDERMSVDDPRRSYDFADFMSKWRLGRLNGNEGLPPFETGVPPSFENSGATEDITPSEMTEADVDMQGLRWKLLGPTRDDALATRAILHPSKNENSDQGNTVVKTSSTEIPNNETIDDEMIYQFRAFLPQHRANFSHYQLRNVLAANNRNDIFYAQDSRVMHTSLSCPSSVKPIMDLSKPWNNITQFQITCLATNQDLTFGDYRSDNVLIAGGFFGEYAIRNLALDTGDKHHEGCVTNSHNGLINYVEAKSDRLSGSLKAAFCSNDHKVRIMDTRTLRFIDCFTYENAINCCSTSPDGRLRALIGDSQETLITNAENGQILMTLKEHKDHGFSCAWSPDSRYLATSAQDNQVVVWDTRRWDKPLHYLPNVMSCPRTLHFANDGALVVSEDDDVVSIYDVNFNSRQDIRFFGSIAGLALLDGGAEMVVSNADRTVGGLLTFQKACTDLSRLNHGQRRSAHDPLIGQQAARSRLSYSSCGIDVFV